MAISKIIYKSSAQDTGTVWMDTTQKTVTSGSMLSGTTALKNDGTDITGSIASKSSSDLTANVLTVTAPAGHYASAASKTLTDQYLLAENIKKDISIFGVTGTYEGGGGSTTWETVYNGTVSVTGLEDDYYLTTITFTDTIDFETIWRITWNGTPYECTATSSGITDFPPYALGNASIVHLQGGNNEPFYLQKINSSTMVVVSSTSQTVSLKIEKQVSGGGSTGLEYEMGTYTPVSDVASDQVTISFANSHTELPFFIAIVDQTGTYDDTTYTQHYWYYANHYVLFGNPVYYSTTKAYYAQGYNRARETNTASMVGNAITYTSQSDDRISNENFKPYYSANYYYRSGRTYKWIAVWKPST